MRACCARLLLVCSFWSGLFAATCGAAQERVSRYLADGRVHVAVVPGRDPSLGQLWWTDTVTGASGGARLARVGTRLVVEWSPGVAAEAHLVPDVAILLASPPWGFHAASLGLSLD